MPVPIRTRVVRRRDRRQHGQHRGQIVVVDEVVLRHPDVVPAEFLASDDLVEDLSV
jgi:hypothetical protein